MMKRDTAWGLYSRLYYSHTRVSAVSGEITTTDSCCPATAPFGCASSAGKSLGDFASPFSSFYFGAFGNNYMDHGTIDRYRDYYSFPGVGIDAIGARSFGKLLGEYNLPPLRFRRARRPPGRMSTGRG